MAIDANLLMHVDIAYNTAERLVDELSTFVGEARPPISVVMMSGIDDDYQRGLSKRQKLWDERANFLGGDFTRLSEDIDQLVQLFKPIEGIMLTALYPVKRFEYGINSGMFVYMFLRKAVDDMDPWVYEYISLLKCERKQKSLGMEEYQTLFKKRPVDAPILKSFGERLKYEREIICEHLSKSFTDPLKEVRAEALAAVVSGGLAAVIQAAKSSKAGDRCTATIRAMCASDVMYYSWTSENWVGHLKASKPTVIGCDGWMEIMAWRAAKKQTAMPAKSAKQIAELSRRKQRKKLAE